MANEAVAELEKALLAEPTFTVHGGSGQEKNRSLCYWGGAVGQDGKIYIVPRNAAQALCFDPTDKSWKDIGETFENENQPDGRDKWLAAGVGDDGRIFAMPSTTGRKRDKVLCIDPAKGTASELGDGVMMDTGGTGNLPFHDTVGPAADGCFYSIPFDSTNVLVFDPVKGSMKRFGTLDKRNGKWVTGVICPVDGCIYAFPWEAERVLRIDPVARTAEEIGETIPKGAHYLGCGVGSDGAIYAIPHGVRGDATLPQVCRVDPRTGTVTHMDIKLMAEPQKKMQSMLAMQMAAGSALGGESGAFAAKPAKHKWQGRGAFHAPDGCVYGIPRGGGDAVKRLLKIDPATESAYEIGEVLPDVVEDLAEIVAGPDGTLWALPFRMPSHVAQMSFPDVPSLLRRALEAKPDCMRALLARDSPHRTPLLRTLGHPKTSNALVRACMAQVPESLAAALGDGNELHGKAVVGAFNRASEASAALVPSTKGRKQDCQHVGGGLAANGCIYLVPARAERVVKFDTKTGVSVEIGANLGALDFKWIAAGMSASADGCFYAVPANGNKMLRIDPSNDTATEVGDSLEDLKGGVSDFAWETQVIDRDGCVVGIPKKSTSVLRFDPATNKAEAFGNLAKGGEKWGSGVLGPDGMIYAFPHKAKRVLRIDPANRTAEEIGGELKFEGYGYIGAGVGGDGAIYAMPADAKRVLRVVPADGSVTEVGDELPGKWFWDGAVAGADGCVYGIPHNGHRVLRVDPWSRSVREVGASLPGKLPRLAFGTLAPDGTIWGFPRDYPGQLLRFVPPTAPPPGALRALLSQPAALRFGIEREGLRDGVLSLLTHAVLADSVADDPELRATATAERAELSALVRKHLPALPAALGWDAGPLPMALRQTLVHAVAQTSRMLNARPREYSAVPSSAQELDTFTDSRWAEAEAETPAAKPHGAAPPPPVGHGLAGVVSAVRAAAVWQQPSALAPAVPLAAAFKAVQSAGAEALDVAWPVLAPLASQILWEIVEAVRVSNDAATHLEEVYNDEKEASRNTYGRQLMRVRRDHTFTEYKVESKRLYQQLKKRLRIELCRQRESSFPALWRHAATLQERFNDFLDEVSSRAGATASKASLKGGMRAVEKMALRPGAGPGKPLDSSKLCDVLRGSLVCADFTVLTFALELLESLDVELTPDTGGAVGIDRERFGIKLLRMKDRYTEATTGDGPTSGGWADLLVNFTFASDGAQHVCELQLQHAQLLLVRSQNKGHQSYNRFRAAHEVLESVGKQPKDDYEIKEEPPPLEVIQKEGAGLRDELKELRESLAWLVNEKTQRIEALEADNKKLRLELDDVKMELKHKASAQGVAAVGGGISAIRAATPRDAPVAPLSGSLGGGGASSSRFR